jgi:hypothetical protein
MLQLYFTKEEMVSFLEKQGYTIKKINTWKSFNTYHNQVEDSIHTIDVALKDPNQFDDDKDYHHVNLDKFSVKVIFGEEIKLKLLSL